MYHLLWESAFNPIFPGPIVRIAPGQYSIDDPNATKIIYGTSPNWHKVRFIPPSVINGRDTIWLVF